MASETVIRPKKKEKKEERKAKEVWEREWLRRRTERGVFQAVIRRAEAGGRGELP